MNQQISDLIDISGYYGSRKEYVIAGGGNTSYKDENTIWVKASGQPLAGLTEESLVTLSREKLQCISSASYPDDPVTREARVKEDLMNSILDSSGNLRPSVETSLHEIIEYSYVVHLHPTIINGLLCSRNAKKLTDEIFGDKVLFIPYTDPGYTLFMKLRNEIELYREKFSCDPQIIFLGNHGSFVGANTAGEVKTIYNKVLRKIKERIQPLPEINTIPYNPILHHVLPGMRMMLSEENTSIIRHRNNSLIAQFYTDQQEFHKISLPLTPDIIVYCKTRYMYVDQSSAPEKILSSLRNQLARFEEEYGYKPRIVVIKDLGAFSIAESYSSAEVALDVYEDMVKISYLASLSGGIKLLTPEQVSFIDRWEVENYRRKISQSQVTYDKLNNRVAVITGGAQGFGAGIAEALFSMNVNIVIADLNKEKGAVMAESMNDKRQKNSALFTKTDVSDPDSVKEMIKTTVREFGGLDIMISNAGILKAGGLEETEPETFFKSTSINYSGYFLCAKYAAEVMKLQNSEDNNYFTDIIQVNSKSGLRGSNRNFAYSGAKFGGIGLTQSFALELAPFRIKVNAVCPGNFYEGPLWSDPDNGLFVQYLKTGKVPGAKSVEEVRQYYENQVPLKRGCRIEDLIKAILYVINQDYETGQAVPVTGGQIMLH